MASDEPMVEVPIVFASSSEGALNSRAIMDTHPTRISAYAQRMQGRIVRTVLDIGADGILFVVDEVLRKGVPTLLAEVPPSGLNIPTP